MSTDETKSDPLGREYNQHHGCGLICNDPDAVILDLYLARIIYGIVSTDAIRKVHRNILARGRVPYALFGKNIRACTQQELTHYVRNNPVSDAG